MNEGIVVAFMTSQTCMELIATTPSFTGDASPDMSWLNKFIVERTTVTSLETKPTSNIRNMLISFDQTIADIEPLFRTIPSFPTVTTHLTTIEPTFLMILYG